MALVSKKNQISRVAGILNHLTFFSPMIGTNNTFFNDSILKAKNYTDPDPVCAKFQKPSSSSVRIPEKWLFRHTDISKIFNLCSAHKKNLYKQEINILISY